MIAVRSDGPVLAMTSPEQLEALGEQPTVGEVTVVNGTSVHDCPECEAEGQG